MSIRCCMSAFYRFWLVWFVFCGKKSRPVLMFCIPSVVLSIAVLYCQFMIGVHYETISGEDMLVPFNKI